MTPALCFILGLGVFTLPTSAAPAADLVTSVPGFGPFPFKMYSGYLRVAGPLGKAKYDSVTIHYELHMSQRAPSTDPLLTWHQGGPGGSSMYGAYAEMGYFQTDSNGTHTNPYAWNRIANMLYLESPAGCDDPIGFSYCTKDGKISKTCEWDDKTQAEAYAHTLAAFFQEFPEFKTNDLYMTVSEHGPPGVRSACMAELRLCFAGRVLRGAVRPQHRAFYRHH